MRVRKKRTKICGRKPSGLFKDKLTVSEVTFEILQKNLLGMKMKIITAGYKLYSID